MGRRRWTNVMIEGGSEVLGTCFDLAIVDEVHVFIANKIAGGAHSGPVDGVGHGLMADADQLESCQVETIDEDLYISGRIVRPDACLRESGDQAEQSRPSDASS
jgi:diaminohydroxyphosphoribosylaminopyrimidine deaminase/5-amino-6-(5-phosphoribosylamino)uracil reductase